MTFTNRMRRTLGRADSLPALLRPKAVSLAIRRAIPFVGTAGVDVLEVSPTRVELALANRRRVRNHIGGVHAAASALLAETASGLVVGMNVPDDAVPVLREMRIRYVRRAEGGLRASARLEPRQAESIQDSLSGDVEVPVMLTDAAGAQPVECVMTWAWRPKR